MSSFLQKLFGPSAGNRRKNTSAVWLTRARLTVEGLEDRLALNAGVGLPSTVEQFADQPQMIKVVGESSFVHDTQVATEGDMTSDVDSEGGGNSASIDTEMTKLKRMIDKRSQMFQMLNNIVDKY